MIMEGTAEFFTISAFGYLKPRLKPQAAPARRAERFCREPD